MRRFAAFLAATAMLSAPLLAAEHNTDPTFANTAYFSLSTGWTHTAGKLTGTGVQGQRAFHADASIHAGDVIHYSITVANWTAGSLQLALGPTKTGTSGVTVLAATTRGETDIPDNFTSTAALQPLAASPADDSADPNSAFRFLATEPAAIGQFDPIVAPGIPGAGHLHTFYCNTGVNPWTNYHSLRTSGGTTCGIANAPANRSSYWQPAMLDGEGNMMLPYVVNFYYKGWPSSNAACGFPDSTHVGICTEIPNGLRYVAGYNMSTMTGGGTQGEPMFYECQDETNGFNSPIELYFAGGVQVASTAPGATNKWPTMKAMHDAGCRSGPTITIKETVEAPICWDGVHLDLANDHRSYMSYPTGPNVTITWTSLGVNQGTKPEPSCPTDHPYMVPSFSIQRFYHSNTAWDAGKWRLASDEQMGSPVDAGTTAHMDYFEGWSPTIKDRWHAACTEAHRTCAFGDIGDGYRIPTAITDSKPSKYFSISLSRFGYSKLLSGNGTFTGEVRALYGGGFYFISPDGFTGDITALSITDITKSKNHAPITTHGSK